MKNGIVILNIPRKCNECRFCTLGFNKCMLKIDDGYIKSIDVPLDEKPDWCPIKEMPQRIDPNSLELNKKYFRAEGWNACINKILGDKDEILGDKWEGLII